MSGNIASTGLLKLTPGLRGPSLFVSLPVSKYKVSQGEVSKRPTFQWAACLRGKTPQSKQLKVACKVARPSQAVPWAGLSLQMRRVLAHVSGNGKA